MPEPENNLQIPQFSVVMPIFNEEDLLESTVLDVVKELDSRNLNFELILVENGSVDKSASISDNLSAMDSRIVSQHLPRPSYGDALQAGYKSAIGDITCNFSIDTVDFIFFDQAISELESADLILGSKLIDSQHDERPLHKQLGSRLFHQIGRRVLGIPAADTHGIKMMKREALASVLQQTNGGGEIFDDELVLRAHRAGIVMVEIPFRCEEIRPSRTSVFPRAVKAMRQIIGLRYAIWKEQRGS
jgi:glycosyltransferase involved in cell wall biosynthesis